MQQAAGDMAVKRVVCCWKGAGEVVGHCLRGLESRCGCSLGGLVPTGSCAGVWERRQQLCTGMQALIKAVTPAHHRTPHHTTSLQPFYPAHLQGSGLALCVAQYTPPPSPSHTVSACCQHPAVHELHGWKHGCRRWRRPSLTASGS